MTKAYFLKWANENPLDFQFFWHDYLLDVICEAQECGDYFGGKDE